MRQAESAFCVANGRAVVNIDVRFGSKADMCSAKGHVRFTPESGHVRCKQECPLCANSGHLLRLEAIIFDRLAAHMLAARTFKKPVIVAGHVGLDPHEPHACTTFWTSRQIEHQSGWIE